MKLERTTSYDSKDLPYQVYRFKLSNGDYLDVDADLADVSGNAEKFCESEVALAEKESV